MAKKILLADKSTYSRWTLRDIFQGHGFTVVGEAKSGEEALEQYEKLRPDMLIMDLSLSEPAVVAAIYDLRMKYPDVCILVSCGMGQRRGAVEALSSGAQDFITRPYNERRVLQVVKKIIG